ncbi:transcriptional regulator [Planotetraspora thailandica]|uniref:Transcriptional regulator n=1 Tax=Planotetraspora thailandica TaxID=487172 RepID=A0A8J3XWH6_9ACTN|nr:helix-turn-helix transcriptional regulator [Planotetraspora thailandica]GII54950.1 transcriptional regulator [Planotetraspora thailandica]
MSDLERRRELGRFLRDRRARLTPQAVGLPPGERRRTPGLRREEVAQLTHISTTWYTWLEQGRGSRPSLAVLDALARALRLGPDEHDHLLALCGYTDTLPVERTSGPRVAPAVQTMLDALNPIPAYVINLRYDVLAWNDAQRAFTVDYPRLPAGERNTLWLLFHHPVMRQRFLDWSTDADVMVAQFRAITARQAGRADLVELLNRLTSSSEEFRNRWTRHEVRAVAPRVKQCRHPSTGRIDLEAVTTEIVGATDLRLVAFTPADPASAARLPLLLNHLRSPDLVDAGSRSAR